MNWIVKGLCAARSRLKRKGSLVSSVLRSIEGGRRDAQHTLIPPFQGKCDRCYWKRWPCENCWSHLP